MAQAKLIPAIKECLKILSLEDRRKYKLVVFIQACLSLLDLAGVALLGVIGALAIRGVQSQPPGTKVVQVLQIIGISNLKFQNQIAILAIISVVLLISKTIITVYLSRRILFFLARKSAQISSDLISKTLAQNLLAIQSQSSLENQYAIGNGVAAISLGVLGIASTVLADATLLLIIGIGVFVIDPFIALSAMALFTSVGFLLYWALHKRAQSVGAEITTFNIESNIKLSEVLFAYREIFVRNRRFYYAKEISNLKFRFAHSTAEQTFLPNVSKYVVEVAVTLGAILIAGLQFLTRDASHAVAGLAVFLAAGSRIAPALLRLQQSLLQIQGNIGAGYPTLKLIEDLKDAPLLSETTDIVQCDHTGFSPEVELEGISFIYEEGTEFSLKNISLAIQPGEFVAVVGSSGAGKTTLIDLILGINTPNAGTLAISGMAPAEAISKWPGAISYVPQEVGISNVTLRQNIALGFPDEYIDNQLILDSLKIAKLEEFVNSLPDGFETMVGERGARLSAGQRQRLGIARAMYSKPKLLVLDEATSNLDGQTESDISSAIQNLKGTVTVIMIAHRLSTVRNADMVVYLHEGKIIATGTFDEVRIAVPDFDRQAQLMGL
jgi:ABC-type multidrug transport system fused ATPase/permease subunit